MYSLLFGGKRRSVKRSKMAKRSRSGKKSKKSTSKRCTTKRSKRSRSRSRFGVKRSRKSTRKVMRSRKVSSHVHHSKRRPGHPGKKPMGRPYSDGLIKGNRVAYKGKMYKIRKSKKTGTKFFVRKGRKHVVGKSFGSFGQGRANSLMQMEGPFPSYS
jgi:hypothetical protein